MCFASRRTSGQFPPPWFSPLGTPLSEAPPFKRKSTRGENPSRLRRRFAGGTQHGSLLFFSRRPWPERIPNFVADDELGTRSVLRVADSTPTLCQSPQPPMNGRHTSQLRQAQLLSCVPAVLLWGAGSVCNRLAALHTVADSPRNRLAAFFFSSAPVSFRVRRLRNSETTHRMPPPESGRPFDRIRAAADAAMIAARIPSNASGSGQRPEPSPFGRSTKKRGHRMTYTAFERISPCPDTPTKGRGSSSWEIWCVRQSWRGGVAGPRAVLPLRYRTSPEPPPTQGLFALSDGR